MYFSVVSGRHLSKLYFNAYVVKLNTVTSNLQWNRAPYLCLFHYFLLLLSVFYTSDDEDLTKFSKHLSMSTHF